jgi:hypothetical protein
LITARVFFIKYDFEFCIVSFLFLSMHLLNNFIFINYLFLLIWVKSFHLPFGFLRFDNWWFLKNIKSMHLLENLFYRTIFFKNFCVQYELRVCHASLSKKRWNFDEKNGFYWKKLKFCEFIEFLMKFWWFSRFIEKKTRRERLCFWRNRDLYTFIENLSIFCVFFENFVFLSFF